MKKIYILAALVIAATTTMSAQYDLEETFETYTDGAISGQATYWRTWSAGDPAAESGIVQTAVQAAGAKALEINEVGAPAGIDQLLLVETEPFFDVYTVGWKMLIPEGRSGYFNAQGAHTDNGAAWNQWLFGGNVYFNQDNLTPGAGTVDGTPGQVFEFPHGDWFDIRLIYDMDNQLWTMEINGVVQFDAQEFTFNDPFEAFTALDFYATSSFTLYYLDQLFMGPGDLASPFLGTESFEATGFKSALSNNILTLRANEEISNVSIYNMLGQEVYRSSTNTSSINMSSYANGTYIVKVNIAGTEGTVKIVK